MGATNKGAQELAVQRVVHVVSSLSVGGMEHFAVRMAAWQKCAGMESSILSLQGSGPLQAEAEAAGVPVLPLGGANKAVRVLKGISTMLRLRPQIVHGHNQTSVQYALLGRRMIGAKVLITAHGRGKADYREPTQEEWRQVSAVTAVSEAVAEEICDSLPAGRLSVILNGVETSVAKRSREETRKTLGIAETEIVGTIVARIDAMKGHDTLLEACAILKRRNRAFTLLIVGDGVERDNRERLSRELNLSPDKVRFLGFRKDVPDILSASDFFMLPSLTEGLPLSVLEAMSHGLPVVATNVGGIPELIQEGVHGLLVPPKNQSSLANAMEQILTSPVLGQEMGRRGALRVQKEFSFNSMMEKYSERYEELLNQH